MWYFTWILGLSVAVLFAVVNAIWLELQEDDALFTTNTNQTLVDQDTPA